MPSPPEGRITTEPQGHVLLIGFDRAHKRNAFGPEMLRGLADAYARLEREPELRCGVVFAHGPVFTAGLDLAVVGPLVARGAKLVFGGDIDPFGVSGPQVSKPPRRAVCGAAPFNVAAPRRARCGWRCAGCA